MRHAKGPLLTVDVGEREARTERVDSVLEAFVGGRGAGTRLAFDRVPFGADPLGPENRLVFTAGPLQASTTSFTGRMNCTGLSPLTDGLLSSNAGGFLSRNFLDTGYGAIEVVGESEELLAVHVRNDGVEFEAVPELENALVSEGTEYAEREYGLGSDAVACIGPAGENVVRFASIMTSDHRTFGRGGLGAVMGAKNVKLLTVAGESEREGEFPEQAMEVGEEIHREAATSDHALKRQGTAGLTDFANQVGALPTRYFAETSFENAGEINGDRIEAKKHRKGTCSQCAFACKLPTRDDSSGLETEGPEFETVMAFGSNAGLTDVVDVMGANDLCDEFGMDTISCGDTVSAYLASEDAFGDGELVHETIRKIAHREGIGDTLAEGIARCHAELGVRDWTMKGMEFAAHDGRALNGQGLAFATANRGADHLYGSMYVYEYPFVPEEEALDPDGLNGKAEVLADSENHNAVLDSAILCKFSRDVLTDERLAGLLDADLDTLDALGARIVDLERAFNNRRGRTRADDDALPYDLEGLDAALEEYYDRRGWTPDGTVPDGRLDASLTGD